MATLLASVNGATVKLVVAILLWYLGSIFANNLSKEIQRFFPRPMLLTEAQFGFLILFSYASHLVGFYQLRWLSLKQLYCIFPLGLGHVFAHLLTQISLGNVPVSFTHTIKATSPIFSVILAHIFLKERFSKQVLLSLIPIILGVSLSTLSEVNFNAIGFFTAFGSCIIFACQNIYSKKLFADASVDHLNLVMYTAFFAFFLMLPPTVMYDDGWLVFWQLEERWYILWLYFLNGLFHWLQNVAAFSTLALISPVSYSVANCFKRVFVIVSSVIYFGNEVRMVNALGIGMAIGGVWLYNQSRIQQKRSEITAKLNQVVST